LTNPALSGALSGILSGVRILICRPEPSASELATALESMGASCKLLPTLSIYPIEIDTADRQTVMGLDQYQHIIVTSQHAAKYGLAEIDAYWPQFPLQQNWFAIGRKTAKELSQADINLVTPEGDLTSEKLLQHNKLKKIRNNRVLILKGKDGRQTLQSELEKRGAQVSALELYVRNCPQYSKEYLQQSVQDFDPDYTIALSGETLLNLISLCQHADIDLKSRSFVLSSQRVANIALEHGLKTSYIPSNLMPIDIIRCIAKARKTK